MHEIISNTLKLTFDSWAVEEFDDWLQLQPRWSPGGNSCEQCYQLHFTLVFGGDGCGNGGSGGGIKEHSIHITC